MLALLHLEGNSKLVVCISNGGATLLVSTNPRENNDNSEMTSVPIDSFGINFST